MTSELAAQGAVALGGDTAEELLQHARSRHVLNAEFRAVDLRGAVALGVAADGIWSSFTAAYFVDLCTALASWEPESKA